MTEQELLAAKRPHLELRGRVLQAIRSFFHQGGFLETQTPVLTGAPAPEAHIDAITAEGGHFLVTSPELYMKRLLAAGYDKIFQITPAFRKGELGRRHHPEFTLLEWYRSGADYDVLQTDCYHLLQQVCRAAGRLPGWRFGGHWLHLGDALDQLTVREAFVRFAGWEPAAQVDQDRFDNDLVEKVEPHLGFPRPCILKDYPSSQAALARLKLGDPSVAERFELYWAGIELANGFSELTDPVEQRSRFLSTLEERRSNGQTEYPLPEAFLRSLQWLPPCAGIALGVDRLVLLLADAGQLDEVVAFPPPLA